MKIKYITFNIETFNEENELSDFTNEVNEFLNSNEILDVDRKMRLTHTDDSTAIAISYIIKYQETETSLF